MNDDPSNDSPPPGSTGWIRIRETLVVVLRGRQKGSGHRRGKLARFIREEKLGLFLVVALTGGMQLAEYHGWLAGIEGKVLDWFLGSPSRNLIAPGSPIVTVEIDDESYRDCFRESSPLDTSVLTQMVVLLAKGSKQGPTDLRPAILGIDILTDSKAHAAAYDSLAKESNSGPDVQKPKIIWASSGENPKVEAASFIKWLWGRPDILIVRPSPVLGIEPGALEDAHVEWGLPVFPRDEDLRLRRFPRRVDVSSDPQHSVVHSPGPSWSRTIAEKYCEPNHRCGIAEGAEEVFLSSTVHIGQAFAANKVFTCSTDQGASAAIKVGMGWEWNALAGRFEKPTIVLLGGTFTNGRDTYETPDGPVSGLLINAYAIQAELDGATISEASRPWTVLGDLGLGTIVVYIFWNLIKVRRMMELALALIPVAFLISLLTFWLGQLWLSCIGVAAGVVVHILVEIYKMDLRKPKHGH